MKSTVKSRKWFIYLMMLMIPIALFAAATASSSGNWDSVGIWVSSNIGDGGETVTFNNNIGEVIVRSGFSYTVGSMDMQQGNTLTVRGTLNIGDASNADDLTTGNTTSISVDDATGSLIIWGDLNAGNNLSIGLGTLTIKGDLIMNNNATMTITGIVQIDGNFIAGTNADVTIETGGSLNVDGSYSVGNGSTMSGTGTATGTPCAGPDAFCINSPLPVELTFFKASNTSHGIDLTWQTTSELNNDYFIIERSENGNDFYEIGTLEGHGTTNDVQNYSFTDLAPIATMEYYRLKQVDYDGAYEYSAIEIGYASRLTWNLNITAYPNPASEKLFFESTQPIYFDQLQLISLSGQVVADLRNSSQGNGLKLSVQLPSLEKGIYYVKYVTTLGDRGIHKLIIE